MSVARASAKRRGCGLRAALMAGLFVAASAIHAQGLVGPAPVPWSSLNAAQRAALAPLERDWSTITPAQQQKWMELANRHATLSPDERARQTQRMTEWSRLSPQDRARARLNFQEARQVSREERQQQWETYRALPPDQRRALAERSRPNPVAGSNGNSAKADPNLKSNLVRVPAAAPARPVGPTVVQRGSGATTNLVSKPASPPLHQQAGLPKVAATPGFVDAATLLPQRGAQGAAARAASAAESDKKKKQ